jgi:DNA-binding CsgD family transcriptional regulator
MNVRSFWKSVQQLLSAAMPNGMIGLTLQHNPVLPMIGRWTRPMPKGIFAAEPLQSYVARRPRKKFVRFGDLFRNRSSFMKSAFCRRYIAPQECAHGIGLFFWKGQRLVCVIAIMRTAAQGELSPVEMKLLRQLYPHFLAALRRLESLERERSVLMGLEEFMGRLPLPTIVLRWTLKPVYQNRAARDFCAVWEKGPEQAKVMKATSSVPSEILDQCRLLKQQWVDGSRADGAQTSLDEQQVHHPRLPHLRATIHLKQLKSAGVARPHFLIRCKNLSRDTGRSRRPTNSHLPVLAGLTGREQQVARLACEGQSNQEIADNACLSLPMVKKHLHSVFHKLEVPSRSRLVALMV